MTTQEQELVVYCDSSYHEFADGGYAACAAYFQKRAVVVGSQHVRDAQEADLAAILVALEYIERYINRASIATVFTESQDALNRINNRSSLPYFQYRQETRIADILLTLAQNKIRVTFRKSSDEEVRISRSSKFVQSAPSQIPQPNPARGLAYAHLLDRVNRTTHNLEQYSQIVGDLDGISFVDTGVPTTRMRASMACRVNTSKAQLLPSRNRVHALVNMFSNL